MQLSRCASPTSTRQVTHLELPVRTWTRSVKQHFHCAHVHPCTACMYILRPAVLANLHLHQVQKEPCNLKHSYHTRTHLKTSSHEPHLPMAPSSDQNSSTPTPTDPDLQATPTYQNNPNLPPTPTLNSHTPNLHDQAQDMEELKQIWSGLSLERFEEETVSYVRIPVHPRTAMAWNQVTQTPGLPMRLEPPPPPNHYQMPRTHAQVRRTVHPYQAPTSRSRVPPVRQWDVQTSSSSVDSSDPLPAAIFRFLELEEVNIAL